MLLIVPYRVDVLFPRLPWATWLLMGLCLLAFGFELSGKIPDEVYEAMVLQDWSPFGLLGHMFLHMGFIHLFGNMIFLWVFGNAVCSRIGNWTFLGAYLLSGLVAAMLHLLISGEPAIGASGAINGVIGLYLALYPRNEICCAYILIVRFGTFEISGFWLILLWFLLDILGAFFNDPEVAYWAHVGGFLCGLTVGFLLLLAQRVSFDYADIPNLLEILFPARFKTAQETAAAELTPSAPLPVYFLYSNEEQLGPYDIPTIKQLISLNQVAKTDLIYDDAIQTWRPINEFMLYK